MTEAIIQALKKLTSSSTGTFFAKRSTPVTELHLSVQGVGPLKLPVSATTAKKLIQCAKPAKFGWRDKTLLDKTVRHAWEIPKRAIKIERDWQTTLKSVLALLQHDLGLPDNAILKAKLHNLLIYEPGQFFSPHQDTEKSKGMVASLVVVLPSAHQGGQLMIDHQGSKKIFQTSRFSLDQLTWIAFYADCHHEVKKIKAGYRIALTYQLILNYPNKNVTAFDKTIPTYHAIEKSLHTYFSKKIANNKKETSFYSSRQPNYFVYLMDHSYTQQGLSQNQLKGVDQLRFSALKTAAEALDLDITLALADVKETWDCEIEFDGYHHPYYHQDTVTIDEVKETELIVSETTLQHWIKPDGTPLDYADCWIPDERLAWTKASNDFQPFESEYEGYMGNYGNTMDYWYHRAAIVLWRKQDYYPVRFTLDPEGILKELNALVTSTQSQQLKNIIQQLLPYWSHYIDTQFHDASNAVNILSLALAVEDAALAKKLVGDLELQALSPKSVPVLFSLQSLYGTTWCTELFSAWTNSKPHRSRSLKCQSIANIINYFSKNTNKEANALINWLLTYQCKQLKNDHQAAIKSQSTTQSLRSAADRIKEIRDFIQACLYANHNKLAKSLLDYVITHPEQYPALELVPLLKYLKKQIPISEQAQWYYPECLNYVVTQLNEEHTKGIQATDDWSIQETWPCTCEDCATLKEFLVSHTTKTLRWPLAKERRKHIHRQIDTMGIPITHKTEHVGSPHKLILTKTTQLHRRAKQRFQRLEKALATLRISIKTKKSVKQPHHESTTT